MGSNAPAGSFDGVIQMHDPADAYLSGYLDMMVMLIGSRIAVNIFAFLLAHWKDGEQLRFYGAFFTVRAVQTMGMTFLALKTQHSSGRRWGGFAFFGGLWVLNSLCLMKIHR